MLDNDLMYELEDEFDQEFEGEDEFEDEFEGEFEDEWEDEFEDEDFPVLGEGEYEEGDYESRRARRRRRRKRRRRRFGKFLGKLGRIAQKVAIPMARIVGTAAGSALGLPAVGNAAGKILGKVAGQGEFEYELDGEFEYEYELDGELEYELEDEFEDEFELDGESEYEAAVAEVLADAASRVSNEAEAEAFAGALTAKIIPIKSASMAKIQPKLVRGAAHLTRALRKSPSTRPLVKTVPTIVRRTSKTLNKAAAKGKKITTPLAAKVMAAQTKKVLGNPKICTKAIIKSSQKARKITKKPAMTIR